MTLLEDAQSLLTDLVALRRRLHRRPEVGLDLPQTQATVLEELVAVRTPDGRGLEITTGTSLTSITAVLRGARPGPAVLLRADMDALPLTEDSGEEFASEVEGAMHACGHDLHTAGLVGAARLLAARAPELAGSVVLMFQPGEEGADGARRMIDEGVLDAAGERVVACYAIHVMTALLPAHVATTRPGPMLAAADTFHVTVHGRGGHASLPYAAADPVPVAAEIVLALQAMVTRTVDPFDPVVLTVGSIHAGTTDNVIPATARLEATVRSFSQASRADVEDRVTRVCEHVAAAHGMTATVDYQRGFPVTVNDPDEAARVARVAPAVLGPQRFLPAPQPVTGSEDFSLVLEEVPGAFIGLGATPATGGTGYNHAPDARFDDAVLADAAALLAALALDRLG